MTESDKTQADIDAQNLADNLLQADKYLTQSNYQQAYVIYINLIQKYPASAEIYNNLAICAHQLEHIAEALNHIEQALELDYSPIYLNQKALFLSSNLSLKFNELLNKKTNIDSNNLEINLEQEYTNIDTIFNTAIELANDKVEKLASIDIYKEQEQKKNQSTLEYISHCYANFLFNLGCSLARDLHKSQQEQAIKLFNKSITYQPNDYYDNYKSFYNIACCYINLDNLQHGIIYLKKTLELNSHHSQAHFALSQYYQQINNTELAEFHLKQSLDSKNINLSNAEYNYGVLEQKRGNLKQALEHYQKSLDINPEYFAAYYNTASVYQKLSNPEKAIDYYKKALAIKPDDASCKYLIASLSSDLNISDIKQAPVQYIENLFDSYADNFDHELINNLDYKTPDLLHKLYQSSFDNLKPVNLNILDLGCGTGLSGKFFKDYAHILTGVDISANMLEQARTKNIYTNLIKSDINKFLSHLETSTSTYNNTLDKTQNSTQDKICYDLIILADVLVYYGDLELLFINIKNNLNSNGHILFSIELANTSESYILNQNGRYAHTKQYIASILDKIGLQQLTHKESILRTQNNNPVKGILYLVA